MECPHAEGCRQRVPPLQQLQLPFICTECKSSTNLWMCVTCSSVYCGRYINAHAKSHNETTRHPITIDCHDLGVYCYDCDDYINSKSINIKVIERLQCVLNSKNNNDSPGGKIENENTEPVNVGVRGSKRKCTSRSSSISDSCSGEKSSGDEGRVKKIKRDNGNNTNGVVTKKHGVVGLRNLGNTCFMNAVLQSLSKINGFSTYMLRIPEVSLENHPVTHYYRTRSRLRPNQTLNASIISLSDVIKQQQSAATTTTTTSSSSSTSSSTTSNQNQTVIHPEEILTTELCKILNSLNNNSGSAVSPDALFSIIWSVMPRFRGYQQQDAHEFLRYMLDRLHTELVRLLPHWKSCLTKKGDKNNGVRKALDMIGDGLLGGFKTNTLDMHNSIVTTVFSGELISEVRCCSCGTESKKHDPFLDLSLDITDGEPKLQDCLSRFVDVEELVDNDMYYCSVCDSRQKSTKRFWITKLPNVLCLHLKRFRWSNYLRTKLDHFVEFPMGNLDMTNYMLNSSTNGEKAKKIGTNTNLYDLAAVIVHHGSGVGSGHYTAFAKKDTDWFNFNDSTVKLTQESIVAKAKAYILFYIRREFQM